VRSLDELKIDRSRNDRSAAVRFVWPLLGLLVLGGGAGWSWWDAAHVSVVRTAAVRQPVSSDGPPTVLNAYGYVTARLQSPHALDRTALATASAPCVCDTSKHTIRRGTTLSPSRSCSS